MYDFFEFCGWNDCILKVSLDLSSSGSCLGLSDLDSRRALDLLLNGGSEAVYGNLTVHLWSQDISVLPLLHNLIPTYFFKLPCEGRSNLSGIQHCHVYLAWDIWLDNKCNYSSCFVQFHEVYVRIIHDFSIF